MVLSYFPFINVKGKQLFKVFLAIRYCFVINIGINIRVFSKKKSSKKDKIFDGTCNQIETTCRFWIYS